MFGSVMRMGVCWLLLLSCAVSTMVTADAAVIDNQSWNELERLDVCSRVDSPAVGDTCALCPGAIVGVSVWRCCHDPRTFEACTSAVDNMLDDRDKRKTNYFLGKKRSVKYFLGKRSFGNDGNYDRQQVAQELAYGRQQHVSRPDKRVKYFLG